MSCDVGEVTESLENEQSSLQVSALQVQEPRLQFCRRQVFHRKLRNQGCSFTRNSIGAVASYCFPHPSLPLASEQTLKDLKSPRGTNMKVRKVDLANWTSPKLTTGVKYQYHQGFLQDQRSRHPNHQSRVFLVLIFLLFRHKNLEFRINCFKFTQYFAKISRLIIIIIIIIIICESFVT